MANKPPSPIIIPDVPNVSLVSFYGQKTPDFTALLLLIQGYLSNEFSSQFTPMPLDQIHGTLIGCEGLKTPQGIINKWFLEKRKEFRYVKIPEFLTFVRQFEQLLVQIRMGGYHPSVDYGFRSQNQHPYDRSFQFQNQKAVIMGWPYYRSQFLPDLGEFRQQAQQFNLLHKYQPLNTVDNDFYLRIGEISPDIPEKKRIAVEYKIRELLKTQSPILLPLNQQSIQFTQYQDLSLPITTTQALDITEITPNQFISLYPKIENVTV